MPRVTPRKCECSFLPRSSRISIVEATRCSLTFRRCGIVTSSRIVYRVGFVSKSREYSHNLPRPRSSTSRIVNPFVANSSRGEKKVGHSTGNTLKYRASISRLCHAKRGCLRNNVTYTSPTTVTLPFRRIKGRRELLARSDSCF